VEGEDFERLRNRYRTAYAWLTHQTAIGGDGSLETLASWSDIEQQRNGAVSEEKGEFTLLDRRDARIFGLSQTLTLGESGLGDLLSVGWEGRRFDADFDYEKNLEPDFRILAPFAGERPDVHHFDERLEGHHLGLWVIERLSPLDRLITEIGLRYDRHDSTDETLLSPRLSAAWSLGERSVLRAAWGRFAQSQRPYELEIADGATQLARSERARQWVMGYETMLRRPRLGALAWNALRFEAYRRDTPKPRRRFENLLEPVNFFPEAEPDRVLLEPTQSRAWGVEMLARGGRSRISWWLAYSYARSEDRFARDAGPSAGSGRFVPRGMDQPHAVTLDVDWRLSESWRINAAWRYHTGWPITPVSPLDGGGDEEAGAVFGALASRRLPAYHRLDLRLSRRADLRLGTLTLFLDLQNAYDRANVSGIDVSIDEDLPDGFELLAEYWPGIVPSVGVRWDF
jgi:outer membrane receptor protein involved in Fe transport